jgi:hypothetical protein
LCFIVQEPSGKRQADRRLALQPTEAGRKIASLLDVDTCDVGVAGLEQQRFLDDEGAVAGEGRVQDLGAVARRGGASLTVQH